MENKKSNAGRKRIEDRKLVKDIRFHFILSEDTVEKIGGKSNVYKFVKSSIKKYLENEQLKSN
jgi:hypothetical protein